jgi:hypothetical protein
VFQTVSRSSYPRKAVGAIFQVVGEGNSHSEFVLTAPTSAAAVSVDACHRCEASSVSSGASRVWRPMCHSPGPLSRDQRHWTHNNAPLFSCFRANKSQDTGHSPQSSSPHFISPFANSRPHTPISYPAFFSVVWNIFSFLESSTKEPQAGARGEMKLERWGRAPGRIVAISTSRTRGYQLRTTIPYWH